MCRYWTWSKEEKPPSHPCGREIPIGGFGLDRGAAANPCRVGVIVDLTRERIGQIEAKVTSKLLILLGPI
jgi:hypothetical protein